MALFDLLFLALALTALVSLLLALGFAVARHGAVARRILRRLGVGAAAYFAVVIVVSAIAPRRVYQLGQTQCFDDWCVTPDSVHRESKADGVSYTVGVHISSRARRVVQRERNLSVFLTDARGHRYDCAPRTTDVPFSTLLGPGESVTASREFVVPASAHNVNLVITHEGGFPIGWLIIGYDTWFRKPPLVRLNQS